MASEIRSGVLINYASIAIRLATQFLLTPFVINRLGVAEYGLFMLSNSVIVWLSLTDFGLGATVSKYVVTYRAKDEYDKQAHFLGQSTMLLSILGVITLLFGVICYFYLPEIFPTLTASQHETLNILYLLTLSNLILSFPLRPLSCVPGAYQKFIAPGLVSLATALLNASLTVMLLFLGYSSIGLTALAVSLGILKLVWGIYYTIRCLGVRIIFSKPDIPLYKEMFCFSIWVFMSQLMDLFYWRAGSPILAMVSGTDAVTLFTLGITLAQIFTMASTAIAGVVTPRLVHMVALNASREELTSVMIRAGRAQLCVLILIVSGFAILGKDFLRLWIGNSIGESIGKVWLGALIVFIPLLIPLTQNAALAILQALNIHKGRAIILFYTSLVCVVLGYILSLHYGAIGMFIGTAVSLILGQIIMINIYYSRKAGLHIRQFFLKTYIPILPSLLIMLSCGFLIQHFKLITEWKDFVLAGVLFTLTGVFALWFLYLNKEEKQTFILPVKRIFHLS